MEGVKDRKKGPVALTAAEWNARYSIGTCVRFWIGSRECAPMLGATRSRAWTVCGWHLVLIDGCPGGIDLENVEPIEEED